MSSGTRLTVASLFCGIGGLDLGFTKAGYDVVWASDISQNAVNTYRKNLGIQPICKDLKEVEAEAIPKTDVIIGGPPCQAFSLVGKRRQNDPRGELVFRFLDVVGWKRPEAFVMENVPGMAASYIEGTRLPELLATRFTEFGYYVKVVKLSAVDFLVPQKRQRLFILGSLKSEIREPNPWEFSEECYGENKEEFDLSARAAIGDLGSCVGRGDLASYRSDPASDFAQMMRSNNGDYVSLHECPKMSEKDIELVNHIPPGGNYTDIPDEIATPRVMKFKRTGGRTTTYGRLHPDRPAYTINTYFRRPNVGCNFHYEEKRLITPREAMRFQSIPDYFEIVYSSQDERNAFIGNAVPPLLAQAIAWSVMKSFTGKQRLKASQQPLPFSSVDR